MLVEPFHHAASWNSRYVPQTYLIGRPATFAAGVRVANHTSTSASPQSPLMSLAAAIGLWSGLSISVPRQLAWVKSSIISPGLRQPSLTHMKNSTDYESANQLRTRNKIQIAGDG
jgi:hypothetical protein